MLEIERIVNEQVLQNTPVQTDVKKTDEAIAAGAMALFGEKYGDRVRVVSMPGFSMELCGGTHVRATGDIGLFAIVSESGVAAGVRRIEAITRSRVAEGVPARARRAVAVAAALTARPGEIAAASRRLQDENKRLGARTSAGADEGRASGSGRRPGATTRRWTSPA